MTIIDEAISRSDQPALHDMQILFPFYSFFVLDLDKIGN